MATIEIQEGNASIEISEKKTIIEIGTYMPSGGGGGDLLAANNLSDVADASTSRTNLGLQIGLNVQAYNSDIVIDASYVHTDNNFTNTLKTNYDTAYTHSQATHAPTDADNTANNETSHANVAVTDVAQEFTKSQKGTTAVVNDGVIGDMTLSQNFSITPAANVTIANPTTVNVDQGGKIYVDASTYTIAFGSYYKFAGGTTPTLTGDCVLGFETMSATEIVLSEVNNYA